MRFDPLVTPLTVLSGLGLAYLYSRFAWFALGAYASFPSIAGSLILSTQLVRLGALILTKKGRTAGNLAVFELFSIEVLLIPVLAVLSAFTGDRVYFLVFRALFGSWVPAFFVCVPLVFLFRFCASMERYGRLSMVLPSAALQFALFSFLYSFSVSGGNVIAPEVLTEKLELSILGQATGAQYFGGTDVQLAAVSVYSSLILYSIVSNRGKGWVGTQPLLVVLAGSALVLASALGLAAFGFSSIYLLTIPTAAIAGALALLTHES